MAEQLNKTVATVEFDKLISSAKEVATGGVIVAAGQGALKRGTALAVNAAGKMVILGTESATADCILAKDIDATDADVETVAITKGHVNKDALIVKDGYTITTADVATLRTKNIILENEV